MLAFLDLRTLSFSLMVFCFLFGLSLIVYAKSHPKFKGIVVVGIGFVIQGFGFIMLSFRDLISDFLSILVSNSFIYISSIFLYFGLTQFRNARLAGDKHFSALLLVFFLILFSYFTYVEPNINYRIIIISVGLSLQFFICAVALLRKARPLKLNADAFLGFMLLAHALIYLFRAVWTFGEQNLDSFLHAGSLHLLSIMTFQSLVLFTSFSVIWLATTLLEQDLILQTKTDPLTQSYNRRALIEIADMEMSRANRNKDNLSMIMTDIDHFKRINDRYGHQAGDDILVGISSIIKANVREHDYVFRYGGEEFLILLPNTNILQAYIVAQKLRNKIMQHIVVTKTGENLQVTASFGVSTKHSDSDDWQQIINSADINLYHAKEDGRNCVVAELNTNLDVMIN